MHLLDNSTKGLANEHQTRLTEICRAKRSSLFALNIKDKEKKVLTLLHLALYHKFIPSLLYEGMNKLESLCLESFFKPA